MLNPRIEANRLHSLPDCYKIKLRSSGYRLVYQVIDHEVVVFVVAVDRREREQAYRKAQIAGWASCSPTTERWSRHDEW